MLTNKENLTQLVESILFVAGQGVEIKDIVISDTALFHVKGGKVEGYYVGYDDITEYLISLAKK